MIYKQVLNQRGKMSEKLRGRPAKELGGCRTREWILRQTGDKGVF